MIVRLRFRGNMKTLAEASARLMAPGDAVLVYRGRPRLFLLSCPCGCGERLPINLDARAGPAWTLYSKRRLGKSLFPSFWRETGCMSHFVIWNNRIYLFGGFDRDFDSPQPARRTSQLIGAVRERLPDDELIPFSELAVTLGAVPWDVLEACQRLVYLGLAREGEGDQRGSFGRVN